MLGTSCELSYSFTGLMFFLNVATMLYAAENEELFVVWVKTRPSEWHPNLLSERCIEKAILFISDSFEIQMDSFQDLYS